MDIIYKYIVTITILFCLNKTQNTTTTNNIQKGKIRSCYVLGATSTPRFVHPIN